MNIGRQMISSDKYLGCFLGLAIGDAYGAPFEGGPVERLLWRLIGRTRNGKLRYTDDTQMSIDLASSYIQNNGINQDHLATTFANSYAWSRGYGPGAAWLLKKIRSGENWQDVNRAKFKTGSFGNGAAMRAPVLALIYAQDIEALKKSVVKSAEITHAHPLAIEGAKLIALLTYAALHDWPTDKILGELPAWCESEVFQTKVSFCKTAIKAMDAVPVQVMKSELGNGMAASQSCVTAIYFALKYRDLSYELMFEHICRLGGDTDTIAAMAGAIWGAFHGSDGLEMSKILCVESSVEIIELAEQLYAMASNVLSIN